MTDNILKGRRLEKPKHFSVGQIPALFVSLTTQNRMTFAAMADGKNNRFSTIMAVGIVTCEMSGRPLSGNGRTREHRGQVTPSTAAAQRGRTTSMCQNDQQINAEPSAATSCSTHLAELLPECQVMLAEQRGAKIAVTHPISLETVYREEKPASGR
jgi:hypothetical protein